MRVLHLASVLGLCFIIVIIFAGCQLLDLLSDVFPDEEEAPFGIQVIPQKIEDAIYGQRCVFLVVLEENKGSGVVNLSAIAEGATVTVEPQAINSGQVAEVTVIMGEIVTSTGPVGDRPPIEPVEPIEPDTPETLIVTIKGQQEGLERTETVTIAVSGREDLLNETASKMRDAFIPWFAANHPELGITTETEWTGTIVRPHIVVVMYYLFFSEDWEMGVRWHVMIPPYDWAEIYLRHRTTQARPSYAFKISSLDGQEEPIAVEPPESVWR